MADKVEWQFDMPKWDAQLAKCGNWIADLGYDPYSEGLVVVKYTDDAPAYWGQAKPFPELENAIALIDEMSKIMVRGLTCSQLCKCRCQLVYVASLNEGDFARVQDQKPLKVALHFWLLPRYQHDMGFLGRINDDGTDNDGFAMMAEWRRRFLLRKETGQWGSFTKPKPRDGDSSEWKKYAEGTRVKLKKGVEESQKCC